MYVIYKIPIVLNIWFEHFLSHKYTTVIKNWYIFWTAQFPLRLYLSGDLQKSRMCNAVVFTYVYLMCQSLKFTTSLSLLQEQDLRYLVEKIWSRQSILSAWEDIFDLVLSRWDKHQEWSPWNCILLTKDEAAAHDRLVDLEEVRGGSSWSLC